MSTTDMVAELRAEVSRWWEHLQTQQIQVGQQKETGGLGMATVVRVFQSESTSRHQIQGSNLTVANSQNAG